jgi:hypothetical protein
VTTKTEQGSGATEPTARSADLGRDEDGTHDGAHDRMSVDSLPSIIVDPSAFAAVTRHAEDERTADPLQVNGEQAAPAPEGADFAAHERGVDEPRAEREPESEAPLNGSGEAHAEPSGTAHAGEQRDAAADDGADDRLSIEEAERFAERFRPSWDSLPAVTPAAPEAARAAVITPEPAVALESVLPRGQRRRGLLMVAGAVFTFAALIAMAMMSAHNEPPPEYAATKQTAPKPAKPAPPAAQPAPVAAPTAPVAQPAAPAASTAGAPALAALAQAAGGSAAPAAIDPATAVPADQAVPAPGDPAQAAPTTAPEATVPEPTVPEPTATQSTKVRIQLRTTPATATLLIDDTPVANPFDQSVEKSGKHRVRAEAEGYRETDFTLNFDRNRDLSLRLQKIRVARKPAARRAAIPLRAKAPARQREREREVARPSAQPVPAPTPAPAAKPKGAGFVSESPY